jgi:hypothetical protein
MSLRDEIANIMNIFGGKIISATEIRYYTYEDIDEEVIEEFKREYLKEKKSSINYMFCLSEEFIEKFGEYLNFEVMDNVYSKYSKHKLSREYIEKRKDKFKKLYMIEIIGLSKELVEMI